MTLDEQRAQAEQDWQDAQATVPAFDAEFARQQAASQPDDDYEDSPKAAFDWVDSFRPKSEPRAKKRREIRERLDHAYQAVIEADKANRREKTSASFLALRSVALEAMEIFLYASRLYREGSVPAMSLYMNAVYLGAIAQDRVPAGAVTQSHMAVSVAGGRAVAL